MKTCEALILKKPSHYYAGAEQLSGEVAKVAKTPMQKPAVYLYSVEE